MKLAKEIARARARLDLSVREAATLAHVSRSAVWRAERGEDAAPEIMVKVAKALKVPVGKIRAALATDTWMLVA